jgi:hypothetical protein
MSPDCDTRIIHGSLQRKNIHPWRQSLGALELLTVELQLQFKLLYFAQPQYCFLLFVATNKGLK